MTKNEDTSEEIYDKIDESLEKDYSDFPGDWKPEEDDIPEKILGEVTFKVMSEYGSVLVLETPDDKKWTVRPGRTALKDFLENAEEGDKVGLKYLGKKKSESGREYFDYRTVIR